MRFKALVDCSVIWDSREDQDRLEEDVESLNEDIEKDPKHKPRKTSLLDMAL